jgi:DNA-binding CsgD family transcriptional regulator
MMEGLGAVVPTRAWAMYLLDEKLEPTDVAACHVSDAFLLRYEEVGRQQDPMMAEIISTHAPTHNLKIMSEDAWHRHPLFEHVTSRLAGLDHVLQAPLLGDGRIVGTLNFGRTRTDPPFGERELAVAGALAHHVSTVLAQLPEAGKDDDLELTPRELEVCKLVAAGLNNQEIANCLAISRNTVKEALKRIFRKAHVDARAELVARLAQARLLR